MAETEVPAVEEAAPVAAAKDWAPQAIDAESGVYLEGESGLPANHRLRAEALARARRKSDPDEIVSEDLIADAAARLKAERDDGGKS